MLEVEWLIILIKGIVLLFFLLEVENKCMDLWNWIRGMFIRVFWIIKIFWRFWLFIWRVLGVGWFMLSLGCILRVNFGDMKLWLLVKGWGIFLKNLFFILGFFLILFLLSFIKCLNGMNNELILLVCFWIFVVLVKLLNCVRRLWILVFEVFIK